MWLNSTGCSCRFNDVTGLSQWDAPKYEFKTGERERERFRTTGDVEIMICRSFGTDITCNLFFPIRAKDDGKTYWLDPETGTTSWKKPESLAWTIEEDGDEV